MTTAFIGYAFARDVAQDVYGTVPGAADGIVPAGWMLDTTFNGSGELSTSNGLFAYALKPIDGGSTRVLAFRGTEMNKPTDLFSDAGSIGQNQFDAAALDINQYLASNAQLGLNTELVGHSLGGALVQWTINDKNISAIQQLLPNNGDGPVLTAEQIAAPSISILLMPRGFRYRRARLPMPVSPLAKSPAGTT